MTTSTHHTEHRITTALATIAEHWPHMLPTSAPGKAPGSTAKTATITADDHDSTSDDIDRATRLIAIRRETTDELVKWCRTVIDDRPVTKAPIRCPRVEYEGVTLTWPERGPRPLAAARRVCRCGRRTPLIDGHMHWLDGGNILDMCTFLTRNAQWLAGHHDAEEAADRLNGCEPGCEASDLVASHTCQGLAGRVARHGLPPITDRPRTPKPRLIGTCPLEWETEDDDGQLVMRACGGDVLAYPTGLTDPTIAEQRAMRLPTCDHCGTQAHIDWWYAQMYADTELTHLVTVDELIAVIAVRLEWTVTRDQVRQWKSRGKIVEAGRDARGRTLFNHAAVVTAVEGDAARARARMSA